MTGIPLGAFRLREPVGRGGMGTVWRGEHARQGLPVAVKVMQGEQALGARYRAAFRKEVQAVAGLAHPGVVLVFDHGEAGADTEAASRGRIRAGSPYLAMELAAGTLRDARHATWSRLQAVLLGLLDALAHAHARGVVHRDLKPTNVLAFTRPGKGAPDAFTLADFGLAEVARTAHEEADAISGTPRYMPPEQILGRWREQGPWTDLYALGCLAWELVCGSPPFAQSGTRALVEAHLHEPPPALRPRGPVPEGFEDWLRRLLRKEARARYQFAADAADALRQLPAPTHDGEYGTLELIERATGPVVDEQHTDPRLFAVPFHRAAAAAAEPVLPLPPARPPGTWRGAASDRPPALAGAGLGLWGLRPVPFVGREAERDRLWQELAAVRGEGRARLVLLQGAAGSGKSRLAEWIAERAHETGAAATLHGVHSPMGGPADGLPRMAARFLRCHGLEGAALGAQVETAVRALGSDDPSEWTGLARMMAGGADPAGATPAPQSAADRHALLARLIERATRGRAAVVRLDDVQWGADALAFAERLLRAREEERLPVLLLLTARAESLAERPDEAAQIEALLTMPGASRLELEPMPSGVHHALVEQLLGLEGELVGQIAERTAGNPLFAVQLVGDWVQRGVLQAGPGGFALRAGEAAPLPEDLHEVWADHIRALLDGRPPGFGAALEIAAALGLEVERAEWEQACRAAGLEPPVGMVDALARRRLARRTDVGFAFVHGMLRESLERLAREGGRWAAHHQACARALEPRYARGERGAAERLARHLVHGDRPAEAVEPLLRAAAERRQTSDYARARTLLERRDRVIEEAALPVADPRRGEGWVLRARVLLHEGRLAEVFDWAGRARRAAEEHGWTRALSESLRLQGDAERRRGRLDQAAALYERCVELLPMLDDPHGVAASLWGLGDVHRQRGRLGEARRCFRDSRGLYQRINDTHGVADHAIGEGDVAWQQGDLPAAAACYGQAGELFRTLGNRYGVARALNGLGEVERAAGRLDEAGARYDEALALLERVHSADALFPRVNLALVALARRDCVEARARLLPLASELEALGWRGLLLCVQAGLLACDAARVNWPAWDARFEPLAGEAGGMLEPDLAWTLGVAGQQAAATGQKERARAALSLAAGQWRALGRPDEAERLLRETPLPGRA